jgi:hypothetical protein
MGAALYYAKSALRVTPYFQFLALFKTFKEGYIVLYSNESCKQLGAVINTHRLQISSLNSLSCLRDDCHKQAVLISDSHGDSNQCTPCRGKPDQHATRIPHLVRIWSHTIHISRGQRIATFHESPTDLDGYHCS